MNPAPSLHRLYARVQRLLHAATEQHGQSMVEYAFILSLMVIGLIVIVTVIGRQNMNMYSNISNGFVGH